jgi:hypothetical protein
MIFSCFCDFFPTLLFFYSYFCFDFLVGVGFFYIILFLFSVVLTDGWVGVVGILNNYLNYVFNKLGEKICKIMLEC